METLKQAQAFRAGQVAQPGVAKAGLPLPGQARTAQARPGQARPGTSTSPLENAATPIPPRPTVARIRLSNWAQVATAADRREDASGRIDRYAVEVHKKWSISFACISFVIIGIVMALRFPRGGIGLVIGGGLLIFAIHYIGLTAGESLADRGLVSPWAAMWMPNIVLTAIGLVGLFRVSRESGSTRGGDVQEIIDGMRHMVRRFKRRRPASASEAA